jgi:hypothetical protein
MECGAHLPFDDFTANRQRPVAKGTQARTNGAGGPETDLLEDGDDGTQRAVLDAVRQRWLLLSLVGYGSLW